MFDWLRSVFRLPPNPETGEFIEQIKALNTQAGGGPPTPERATLGRLELPSQSLALADPQNAEGPFVISGLPAGGVEIVATLFRYPSGTCQIGDIEFRSLCECSHGDVRRLCEIGIDSAKIVAADKQQLASHWTKTGRDRIGLILTARDHQLRRLLCRKFRLQTTQRNALRAEIVGRVSESLEREITEYLQSIPRYADYPFMYFYVHTNDSFERANFMEKEWGFLPIGNDDQPLMFICGTGFGDGCYPVDCKYSGDMVCAVTVSFISDDQFRDWQGDPTSR